MNHVKGHKKFKNALNKWAFRISFPALIIFSFCYLFVSDLEYINTANYLLIPLFLISFVLAVISLPLEKKNDKRVIFRAAFSIIVSLGVLLLLAIFYIVPLLFPFGIPPIF